MSLLNHYKEAKEYVIRQGYQKEIDVVNNRIFENQTVDSFHNTFVYVVLNSGMKNQVAEKIYHLWFVRGNDVIKHQGKRNAIEQCDRQCKYWFKILNQYKTIEDRLDFLASLPWIGPITRYHLARNLGLDVAKPDRHLQWLANFFKYESVQAMCEYLSKETGDRVGVVDVVLWRYCNLSPNYKSHIETCEGSCVGRNDYYCDEGICAYVDGDINGS